MNQASKIAQLMKQDLTKLTPWIEGELTKKFLTSGATSVKVMDTETELLPYSSTFIIAALRGEGFDVKYICPDRPCSQPYYAITIPPQSN
ncbi:MAG: hypothetical protein GY928_29750 [Colwellia sp.]|nr:hypothetical protein [Colwellia sp.]